MEFGPCSVFVLYSDIWTTTDEKQSAYPKGAMLNIAGQDSISAIGWRLVLTLTALLIQVALVLLVRRQVLTLDQRRYLSNFQKKGFPTLVNLDLKLSVRAPMCSGKNGTPKSSWICLLPKTGVQRWQGEDTWTIRPGASWQGWGQRTSIWGLRSPPWNG